MAITIVQTSAVAKFSGSATASPSLTGVTSGNTLIALVAGSLSTGGISSFSVNDGSAYTVDKSVSQSGFAITGSARLSAASSGTHTAVVTISGGTGTNNFGGAVLVEVSGLVASPFDTSAGAGGFSTAPATGSTATLAQAAEIYFSTLVISATSLLSATTPPTGGPGTFTELVTAGVDSFGAYDFAYQIQSSGTTAVSASWGTLSSASTWDCSIATYKAAVSAAVFRKTLSGIGGRVGARQLQS